MIEKYLNKLEFNTIKEQLTQGCSTYIGKRIADELEPSSNEAKVATTLKETTEGCELIHALGNFPIFKIDDLSIMVKRLESSMPLTAKYLLEMAAVLKNASELKDYYKSSGCDLERLSLYFGDLYENKNIEKMITNAIISEDEIADKASPKLASIRSNKKGLELEIKNKLTGLLHSNTYSKYIMDPVITIRNDRYVIPVKSEYRSQIKGFIHDTSSSGSTVYIEPMAVFEINNSINNLMVEEQHEIEVILNNLSGQLYPIAGFLNQDINLIGKLDFISAKAKYSIAHDCTCPNIDEFVELKSARHPLIDKNKVVPTSLHIGKENFTTLVITGPNTGGKTVTLKTTGLLCAMAQAGLHIPVSEGSTIKVFDNIFADIGDEQSIEQSLSTFSAHMTNIVSILDTFTDKSLILVDELGSGTDPIEGAHLAISLLETFHNKGAFTLATTHYSEIKQYCLTHDSFENASCEFDIETLKPTYHLLLGIPGKSNAFAICNQLGVPKEIIDRASNLISKPDTDFETLMKQIYDNKKQVEEEKIEIEKNLNQVTLLRKSLEKDNNEKLQKEKAKIEEAKKEAQQILLDAKDDANRIINKLSKMNEAETHKANKLRDELNDKIKKNGGDGLDLSVLLKLNEKDTSSLSKSKKTSQNSKAYVRNNKAKTINTEINLLGLTVDEAVAELDLYFDQAKMAHLEKVRVVHGKGTGKLREGVHQYLKTNKNVKSFKIADYGDGDYGVTIVELK